MPIVTEERSEVIEIAFQVWCAVCEKEKEKLEKQVDALTAEIAGLTKEIDRLQQNINQLENA